MILVRHNPTGELSLLETADPSYAEPDWTVLRTDAIDPNTTGQMYDSSGALVPRPSTDRERTYADFSADPRWAALRSATGAQIDAWLASNVTNLAQARTVLGTLIKALRVLAVDGKLD